MIQLATDPKAARSTWRPAADGKDSTLSERRPRSGHAWPFIARFGDAPQAQQETKRTPQTGSGS